MLAHSSHPPTTTTVGGHGAQEQSHNRNEEKANSSSPPTPTLAFPLSPHQPHQDAQRTNNNTCTSNMDASQAEGELLSFDFSSELKKKVRSPLVSLFRPWALCKFVLTSGSRTLNYFEPGSTLLKIGLLLDPSSTCSTASLSTLPASHRFAFEVVTSTGRLTLAAADAQTRDRWMLCIDITIHPPVGTLSPNDLKTRLEAKLLNKQADALAGASGEYLLSITDAELAERGITLFGIKDLRNFLASEAARVAAAAAAAAQPPGLSRPNDQARSPPSHVRALSEEVGGGTASTIPSAAAAPAAVGRSGGGAGGTDAEGPELARPQSKASSEHPTSGGGSFFSSSQSTSMTSTSTSPPSAVSWLPSLPPITSRSAPMPPAATTSFASQLTTFTSKASSAATKIRDSFSVAATLTDPTQSDSVQIANTAFRNVCGLAVDAAVGAVEMNVPFAATVIAVGRLVYDMYMTLGENNALAKELAELVADLLERLPRYMEFFAAMQDRKGEKYAQKLFEILVVSLHCAQALVSPDKESALRFLARFINAKTSYEALKGNKVLIVEGVAVVAYMFGSQVIDQDARLRTLEEGGKRAKADKSHLTPLESITGEVSDAVQFWDVVNNFGVHASVKVVVQALLVSASKCGYIQKSHLQRGIERYPHFSTLRGSLDVDGDGVTSTSEFKSFLDSFSGESTAGVVWSVSDVVNNFLKLQEGAIDESDEPGLAELDLSTPPPMESPSLEATLSPVDFGLDLSKHWSHYLPGTREWVFEDLRSWLKDPRKKRVFWIQGTGGLGKSIIAAQVVLRGKKQGGDGGTPEVPVSAYFFCKHDDVRRNSPTVVIGTLCFQLCARVKEMNDVVGMMDRQRISALLSGSVGTLDDVFKELIVDPLTEALKVRGEDGSDIVLVLDALDELHEGASRGMLLRVIGKGLNGLPSAVRVIITSRPEADIVAHLQSVDPLIVDKYDELQRKDLSGFARTAVVEATSLRRLGDEEKLKVVDELLKRADGVFLALRFSLEHLKEVESDRELFVSDVEAMPAEMVDNTYRENILRVYGRIDKADSRYSETLMVGLRRTLAALVVAKRPLTMIELAGLCGGERDQDSLLTQELVGALSLLFDFSVGGAIEPLHKTVYDFLGDEGRSKELCVDRREGHRTLALASVRVLRRGVLADAGQGVEDDKWERRDAEENSMTRYALEFGITHLQLCLKESRARVGGFEGCDFGVALELADLLIEKRSGPLESPGGSYRLSSVVATRQCGRLLIEQAKMGRSRAFTVELRQLAEELTKNAASGGVEEQMIKELRWFLKGTVWLLGTAFNPAFDSVDRFACARAGWMMNVNKPVTSAWVDSSGMKELSCLARKMVFEYSSSMPRKNDIDPLEINLLGHTRRVKAVSFSPDGSRIASGSCDYTVKVWSTTTGDLVQTLKGHTDWVRSVSFSPDGSRIASGSSDKTVKVWSTVTGDVMQTFEGHTEWVSSVSFSPDGSRIVSGSDDNTVKVWSTTTGDLDQTFEGHKSIIGSVSFSPDGSRIASGSDDNTVKVWSTATGDLMQTFESHSSCVKSVGFSPDGSRVASGSDDNTVKVWSSTTGDLVQTLKGHTDWVWSVSFSPDGSKMASGSSDKTVMLWSATTGAHVQTLKGHANSVTSVSFSPDGSRVASGSDDGAVKVWSTTTGGDLAQTLEGQTGGVRAISFSPDGSSIASGYDDCTVKLWSTTTGDLVQTFTEHLSGVGKSVGFSPDGSRIASGSSDNTIMVWSTTTGDLVQTLKGHTNSVSSASFSPDGNWMVSGSSDKMVMVWSTTTGNVVHTLEGHTDLVYSVSFSPDGSKIVSGSGDNTVKLWSTLTGDLVQTLKGHTSSVTSVSFSPDGSKIASGSRDKTVKVWSTSTGDLVQTFEGHTEWVSSVSFSPDGSRIASGSDDKTVKVWSTTTGDLVQTLEGHTSSVTSVSFSPDGSSIASGSDDKSIKVWSTTVDNC